MEHYFFVAKLFDFSKQETKISLLVSFIFSVATTIISALTKFSNDFLGISVVLFFLLFLIMITDYKTGLAASKHEEKIKAEKEQRPIKDVFSSKKALGWVFKLGSYLVFLAVSLSLRKHIINEGLDFLDIPMKLIHFTLLIFILKWETHSVDENCERLGYNFKILKLFTRNISQIQSIIKKQN
jgi:Ca2+/Na+ antiporter